MNSIKIIVIFLFVLMQPLRGMAALPVLCPPSDARVFPQETPPAPNLPSSMLSNEIGNLDDAEPDDSMHEAHTVKRCGHTCCHACGMAIDINRQMQSTHVLSSYTDDYHFSFPLPPPEFHFKPPIEP